MMKRNYFLIAVLIIAATLIATLVAYPDLPSRIPLHWNYWGEVNRYGGKSEIFFLPVTMIGVVILFACLPWLSPKRKASLRNSSSEEISNPSDRGMALSASDINRPPSETSWADSTNPSLMRSFTACCTLYSFSRSK